jgi:hypothetical protein
MRPRCLALFSVFAAIAFASPAHGVTLNPRGLGQVLIYPYYTVNKGQDTLITVSNASDFGSLLKVIVNEGLNGREVLDFNLVLAPRDAWTGRISQLADDGGAALFTADTSCTYPPYETSDYAFRKSSYAGGSVFPADGGPTDVSRTREGFIQIIEMGTVAPGSPLDATSRHGSQGSPGVPACDVSVIGNNAGAYLVEGQGSPGALSGSAAIVNVAEGTFFAYAADALAGFSSYSLFNVFIDFLQHANSPESQFPGGAIAHMDAGDRHFSLDFPQSIDAVSAAFMADTVANDYLIAAGLGANTDWVLTFPTKPFYTDSYYVAYPQGQPPFVERFHAPGVSNVLANVAQYDQEEGHGTTSTLTLPWVVNVMTFQSGDDVSGVLGSTLTVPVAPFADAGTMSLDLAQGGDEEHTITAPDGRVLHGLPATGFMVYNIINANAAPGKLANYGGTFPYRSTVSCTTSASDSTPCD